MNQTVRMFAVAMVGAGLVAFAAAPAVCSEEYCPMGTQVKAEVVTAKAVEWGKSHVKSVIADQGSDTWSVLVLSTTDPGIAILLSKGSVFFGIAGKGGQEVDAREAEKVFGRDLRKLQDAMKKELGDLWKDGAVKIDGGDVQKIADAAALGVLEKERGAWLIRPMTCKGIDLDASALK